MRMAQCAICDTAGMAPSDSSAREAAGRWLREQRIRKGFETGVQFAHALGVDLSRVSAYENGRAVVPDERADRIAEVLEMDIITVRRNLGLWVPPEPGPMDRAERMMDALEQDVAKIRKRMALMDEPRRQTLLDVADAIVEPQKRSTG
jgi:transcriptional regulator with XRE-family HTH domain